MHILCKHFNSVDNAPIIQTKLSAKQLHGTTFLREKAVRPIQVHGVMLSATGTRARSILCHITRRPNYYCGLDVIVLSCLDE